MTALAPELQIAALALAASLAAGLPVRVLGIGPTVSLLITAGRVLRRHRLALAGLAVAGGLGGAWSLDSVRALAFTLIA